MLAQKSCRGPEGGARGEGRAKDEGGWGGHPVMDAAQTKGGDPWAGSHRSTEKAAPSTTPPRRAFSGNRGPCGGTRPVLSPHPERCSVFTNRKDRRRSAGHQTKPPRHPRLVQTASGRRPRSSNEVCDRKQRHRDTLNAVRAAGQLADLCNLQNIIKCGHVRLVFWPRRLISSGDGDTPAPSSTTATLPGSPQAAPALACSRSRDRVTSDTQFSRHLAAAT